MCLVVTDEMGQRAQRDIFDNIVACIFDDRFGVMRVLKRLRDSQSRVIRRRIMYCECFSSLLTRFWSRGARRAKESKGREPSKSTTTKNVRGTRRPCKGVGSVSRRQCQCFTVPKTHTAALSISTDNSFKGNEKHVLLCTSRQDCCCC